MNVDWKKVAIVAAFAVLLVIVGLYASGFMKTEPKSPGAYTPAVVTPQAPPVSSEERQRIERDMQRLGRIEANQSR